MADTESAAPAPAPAQGKTAAPAKAEPSTLDLAKLLSPSSPTNPRTERTPATKPAPAAQEDEDHDPDFDGADSAAQDSTAPADQDPADTAQPPADAAAEDPSPEDPGQTDAEAQQAAAQANDIAAELDDEGKSARATFTPEQQKVFDREISKKARAAAQLKRELQARDQRLQELTSELEQAKASPPAPAVPTPDNPLADVADEAALEGRLRQARDLRRWLFRNPQGGTLGEGKDAIEISAERVGDLLADTEDILNQHGPARREFLRTNAQLEAEAANDYPWLKSKTSAGAVAVDTMLRQYGNTRLRDIPGIRGSLADLFIGQVIRANGKKKQPAAASAASTPAAPPKAPSVPSAGANRPARASGPAAQRSSALKSVHETGDDPANQGLAALIAR